MPALPRYGLIAGGNEVPSTAGRRYATRDPYTGEPWAEVPNADAADVDIAVHAARAALDAAWGTLTGFDRARLMRSLAALLERDSERLAEIETRDNGKLLREMRGQTEYLPAWFHYFAGVADKLEGEVIPSDRPNFLTYTRHEPVGVVGAIVPWNSPLLLLAWKLAPGLAAGCTFVVKPSEHTPVSALELAKLVGEAGFPPGVVNVVTGDGPAVGEALVRHPGVDKIAFTGSEAVGAQVGGRAVERGARVTLELGGKSAQIVFEDAELDAATNGVVAGIYAAGGQTCVAGSRLLAHESVHDEIVERLRERAGRIVLGDPRDPGTQMGPLASERQLQAVLGFVERARADGAELVSGGASTGGLFMEPTILTGVRHEMEIAREEVFGPVLAVMAFASEEQAIALANDTRYGLSAGVWTRDVRRAHRVAHAVRAGTVWVNAYRAVAPNVPFGGFGASGFGRENGRAAALDYTETKAIWVELSGETRDPFRLG
jgi:(Z)-2-((N-methylformamido)methylene)-5-hydroxybutyrolactone dehydrogenase